MGSARERPVRDSARRSRTLRGRDAVAGQLLEGCLFRANLSRVPHAAARETGPLAAPFGNRKCEQGEGELGSLEQPCLGGHCWYGTKAPAHSRSLCSVTAESQANSPGQHPPPSLAHVVLCLGSLGEQSARKVQRLLLTSSCLSLRDEESFPRPALARLIGAARARRVAREVLGSPTEDPRHPLMGTNPASLSPAASPGHLRGRPGSEGRRRLTQTLSERGAEQVGWRCSGARREESQPCPSAGSTAG